MITSRKVRTEMRTALRKQPGELLDLPNPPTCILYPDDYAAIGGINEIQGERASDSGGYFYCGI